jgi:hypothetical protein
MDVCPACGHAEYHCPASGCNHWSDTAGWCECEAAWSADTDDQPESDCDEDGCEGCEICDALDDDDDDDDDETADATDTDEIADE